MVARVVPPSGQVQSHVGAVLQTGVSPPGNAVVGRQFAAALALVEVDGLLQGLRIIGRRPVRVRPGLFRKRSDDRSGSPRSHPARPEPLAPRSASGDGVFSILARWLPEKSKWSSFRSSCEQAFARPATWRTSSANVFHLAGAAASCPDKNSTRRWFRCRPNTAFVIRFYCTKPDA